MGTSSLQKLSPKASDEYMSHNLKVPWLAWRRRKTSIRILFCRQLCRQMAHSCMVPLQTQYGSMMIRPPTQELISMEVLHLLQWVMAQQHSLHRKGWLSDEFKDQWASEHELPRGADAF